MTVKRTPRGTFGVDRGHESATAAGQGEEGATPTPREVADARVPPFNDPHAQSRQISCPRGAECALNKGAVRCFHCGRNWPPDETWEHKPKQNPKPRPRWVPSEADLQATREHKRTAIETLLHHYRDVLEGIPDREHRSSDELLALMCPAWNHPSYRQLEKLLARMPRRLRQALRVRYERYSERRVAWCKRCGEHPARDVGSVHRHPPGRSVSLRPRLVRVLPRDDDPAAVESALDWLLEHWVGRVDLPRSVFEIEAERRLRDAA